MNRICVIAKNKKTYFIHRLIEEVGQGVVLFDPWSDFELPEAQVYLTRTTGVYRNDLDLMIMKAVPSERLINSLDVLTRFREKKTQYTWFDEQDLPSLPWIDLKGIDPVTAEKFSVLYPEILVKPNRGQGGWGIEVLDRETFKGWLKKKKREGDEDFLAQPFQRGLPEYRFFFIKGRKPLTLKRQARDGMVANFRAQGRAELASLPESVREKLLQICELSRVHYGAVDFFLDGEEIKILEVNVAPGIEQLEKVTGENVIRSLLESF
jgi:glutathione synthase/RimK-type ligase-like ATP-grasp enzyme